MKHGWWIALLAIPALLLQSGCEDEAANRRAAAAEKKAKEAYKAEFDACQSDFDMAEAKEKANALTEAQVFFQSAANKAAANAQKAGEFKLQFMQIQSQATAGIARVKGAIEQNERIAAAKVADEKRKKEAAELAAQKKKEDDARAAQASAPSAGVAATTTSIQDPTVATPGAGAATAAAGGEDDDPLDAPAVPGAAGAAAADGAKVPSDPFTPLDEKAAFKCYAVKSAKRYAIAYCLIRNTTQKELRVVRPLAEFSTVKGENTWPVVAMFEYSKFKATDWNDLDKDNPDPLGNERISLAPGDAVKVVLMSDKAERDGEYSKAVKLIGRVLWNDATESIVINRE